MHVRHGLQKVGGVALVSAAQPFGLKETPLITRLGLLLRRQRPVILRARHLTRRQPGQHRSHHRHYHGRGIEDFSEGCLRDFLFQFFRYGDFHQPERYRSGAALETAKLIGQFTNRLIIIFFS